VIRAMVRLTVASSMIFVLSTTPIPLNKKILPVGKITQKSHKNGVPTAYGADTVISFCFNLAGISVPT
jgi:hypothetical protein